MGAELLLRAALVVLDDAGDPTDCRTLIEHALARIPPPELTRRPGPRKQRVAWAASQLAYHAHHTDLARAYRALRELVDALFDPIAGTRAPPAPAPEVALTLSAPALIGALAPPPRVLCPELARAAVRDPYALLEDPDPARRLLGLRSFRQPALAKRAAEVAECIVADVDGTVRAEALHVAATASATTRAPLIAALEPHLAATRPEVRAAAIAAHRALEARLSNDRLVPLLRDPAALVRAAAARSAGHGPLMSEVVSLLEDPDPDVRDAALGAVARTRPPFPAALVPTLLASLRAIVLEQRGDPRAAVYVLAALRVASPAEVDASLEACVRTGRSDVARAAELVLQQLGRRAPDLLPGDRIVRATRELASTDRETQLAGLLEARRLGSRALSPAIRAVTDPELRAHVGAALEALGETPPEHALAPWRGHVPSIVTIRGAYAIARTGHALGLWDHGTGECLFVVEHAETAAILAGRAELATIRVIDHGWTFTRHAIPSGTELGALALPAALTHGTPATIASAAGLVTVWCDHPHAPYRFHVKLDPDRLIDPEPVLGRR